MNEEELKALAEAEAKAKEKVEPKQPELTAKQIENAKAQQIREATEKRYQNSFSKKEESYNNQIEELKNELERAKLAPTIQKEFIKAGGNPANFEDYLKLNNSNFDNAETIVENIENSKSKNPWAFGSSSTVENQWKIPESNNSSKKQEFYPGTLYEIQNKK